MHCIYGGNTPTRANALRFVVFSRLDAAGIACTPRKICFYDIDWDAFLAECATLLRELPFFPTEPLTAKDIQYEIRKATTISEHEINLCRRGETERISLSRRFQLAAKRQVTREEDSAYSLMGLFGVDLSIAYGEGAARAFFRLVRELLATKIHVLDLFNHAYGSVPQNRLVPARIIQYFYRTIHFDPYTRDSPVASLLDRWQPFEPLVLTHLGVRIPLLLAPRAQASSRRRAMRVRPKGGILRKYCC